MGGCARRLHLVDALLRRGASCSYWSHSLLVAYRSRSPVPAARRASPITKVQAFAQHHGEQVRGDFDEVGAISRTLGWV